MERLGLATPLTQYRETQRTWIPLACFLLLVCVTVATSKPVMQLASASDVWILCVAVLGPTGASVLILSSFTIVVSPSSLRWWFGFRYPGGNVALSDIESTEVVDVPLRTGQFNFPSPARWMRGKNVEVRLRSGRTVLLGAADPQALRGALEDGRSTLRRKTELADEMAGFRR